MPLAILKEQDYQILHDSLREDTWVAACFCAAWCGACRGWKEPFSSLAEKYPDIRFLWIDIEDHAHLLDELDIDNFPTLLIQRGTTAGFFGCIHPEAKLVERILKSLMETSPEELKRQSESSEERRAWQREAELKKLLGHAIASAR